MSVKPSFEVHLEDWYHSLVLPEDWRWYTHAYHEPVDRLFSILDRHKVRATFYVLAPMVEHHKNLLRTIRSEKHLVGSHGYWHRHNEREGDESDKKARKIIGECVGYRSPYWDTTPRPGFGGGAFFRLLPYPVVRQAVLSSRVFWVHPHDLIDPDNKHRASSTPYLTDKCVPLRRKLGLRTAWNKLERLLNECW